MTTYIKSNLRGFVSFLFLACLVANSAYSADGSKSDASKGGKRAERVCDTNDDGKISELELKENRCEKAIFKRLVSLERRKVAWMQASYAEFEKLNDAGKLGTCIAGITDKIIKHRPELKTLEILIPDTTVVTTVASCLGVKDEKLEQIAQKLKGKSDELEESQQELKELIAEAGGKEALGSALTLAAGVYKKNNAWLNAAKATALVGSELAVNTIKLKPVGAVIAAVAFAGTVKSQSENLRDKNAALCAAAEAAHEIDPDQNWKPKLRKKCKTKDQIASNDD